MGAPNYERLMAALSPPKPKPEPALADTIDPDDPNKLAAMLDEVTTRALSKLAEILELPVNSENGNVMRALSAGINTALTTQAKIDELKLRQRTTTDIMPRLIELMEQEREKMRRLQLEIQEQHTP
jgi:hypothetical protein